MAFNSKLSEEEKKKRLKEANDLFVKQSYSRAVTKAKESKPKEEQRNEGEEHFEQLIKDLYKPVKRPKPQEKEEKEPEIQEQKTNETEPLSITPTTR